MKTLKQRKLSALKQWFDRAVEVPAGYKLKEDEFDSITKGMTAAQLQLMLSLTAATYSRGCDETRKYWSPKYHSMRQQLERVTGEEPENFGFLRLVASNA